MGRAIEERGREQFENSKTIAGWEVGGLLKRRTLWLGVAYVTASPKPRYHTTHGQNDSSLNFCYSFGTKSEIGVNHGRR